MTCFIALGLAVIACEAIGGEQPALWQIQKLLASKKYVDLTHVGQWGTHVDPPAHFIKGLRTFDQIDPKEMMKSASHCVGTRND